MSAYSNKREDPEADKVAQFVMTRVLQRRWKCSTHGMKILGRDRRGSGTQGYFRA